MALLNIGTPPQVLPAGARACFLQSWNFQAKEKKGRVEEEREVKGRDKEVRMKEVKTIQPLILL